MKHSMKVQCLKEDKTTPVKNGEYVDFFQVVCSCGAKDTLITDNLDEAIDTPFWGDHFATTLNQD